jgi:hypothetical protein
MPASYRLCLTCNESFYTDKKHPYCSQKCRAEAANANKHKALPGISTAFTGTYNELTVCLDLMKKGINPYRSVTPGGPDIIALDHDRLFTIEVKTLERETGGSIKFIKSSLAATRGATILAFSNHTETVYMNPLTKEIIDITQFPPHPQETKEDELKKEQLKKEVEELREAMKKEMEY